MIRDSFQHPSATRLLTLGWFLSEPGRDTWRVLWIQSHLFGQLAKYTYFF